MPSLTFSQTTATDFTVNDCTGSSHHLFSELDAGKIVVIAWVMPCGACAAQSLAAYNAVQSYATSNPNQVSFYLVDDVANTSCNSLTTWGNTNSMPNSTKFSDASISMSDYGASGMPKIVVLGGANHTVEYNAISGVTTSAVQQAINSLLSASGIEEITNGTTSKMIVFPNPAANKYSVNYTLDKPSTVSIELYTVNGQLIQTVMTKDQQKGTFSYDFSTENELENGVYIVKLKTVEFTESIKFIIEK